MDLNDLRALHDRLDALARRGYDLSTETCRLLSTAHHEAGHAVIGRILGVPCGRVTIAPEGQKNLGHCVMSDPSFDWRRGDGPKRTAADIFVISLYAGREAEELFDGTVTVGDYVDRERATAALAWAGVRGAQFVGDEHFDRRERHLRRKAREIVRLHRGLIERVADGLMRHETLSSDQVDQLIRGEDALPHTA